MTAANPFLFRLRIRYDEPKPPVGGNRAPGSYLWSPWAADGAEIQTFDVYGKAAAERLMADSHWAAARLFNPRERHPAELGDHNPPFGCALFFSGPLDQAHPVAMRMEDPPRFDLPGNPAPPGSNGTIGIWRVTSSHQLWNSYLELVTDYLFGWPDLAQARDETRPLVSLAVTLETVTQGAAHFRAFPGARAAHLDYTFVDITREDYSSLDLKGANFSGAEAWATNFERSLFPQAIFHAARLVYARFGHADLTEAEFVDCRIDGANFGDALLLGCRFTNCNFTLVDFTDAILLGANFTNCLFQSAVLKGASLIGATFTNCRLPGADLGGADLTRATFDTCTFPEGDPGTEADLGGADLTGATFRNCDLRGAKLSTPAIYAVYPGARTDFTGSTINYPFLGAMWDNLILTGAGLMHLPDAIPELKARHAVLIGQALTGIDLCKADFTGADLRHIGLSGCNLSRAVFVGADLREADLAGSSLDHADFTGASLQADDSYRGAVLSGASLLDAVFDGADLSGADLSSTYFWGGGASLVGATLRRTNFANAYLAGAKFDGVAGRALARANFSGACLVNAVFKDADCGAAQGDMVSFSGACLHGADFTRAALDGANLAYAGVASAAGTIDVTIRRGWPLAPHVQTLTYDAPTIGLEAATDGNSTCPSGATGPCQGAKLVSARAPTKWPA